MDKNNIPNEVIVKIESKAKKHGNQYESKYNAYVDFKRGAEFGYLLAQSENDNMAVKFAEWLAKNAAPNSINNNWHFYSDHSECTTEALFTQFKKSKENKND